MPPRSDLHDVAGPLCCRARLRETYGPGCVSHWIPALRSANYGPWRRGVLLETRSEFEVVIAFAEHEESLVLATLWMDRFDRELANEIERDGLGRPIVRWSYPWRVLQLLGRGSHPVFDMADRERYPAAVKQWNAIPAECPNGRHRRRL